MYVYIEVPQEGLFTKHLMTSEDMQCSLFSFIRTRLGIIEYQKKKTPGKSLDKSQQYKSWKFSYEPRKYVFRNVGLEIQFIQ